MVELSEERYKQLLDAEKELAALHVGGVDNWEWYEECLTDAGLYATPGEEYEGRDD